MARKPATLSLPKTLLHIVTERNIGNQRDLLAALDEAGFLISQPTLSRHMGRLHIVKRNGLYRVEDANLFRAPPYSVRLAPPNLVVLKTLPARAQLLAVLLDQARLPQVAGTTAGDDTVFVAVAEGHDPEAAQEAIAEILGDAREEPRQLPKKTRSSRKA